MEALAKLSPAQSLLLRAAARRADGRVIPPDTLRGGGRAKVLTALLQHGWIEPANGGHVLTDAGYAAIGRKPAWCGDFWQEKGPGDYPSPCIWRWNTKPNPRP